MSINDERPPLPPGKAFDPWHDTKGAGGKPFDQMMSEIVEQQRMASVLSPSKDRTTDAEP